MDDPGSLSNGVLDAPRLVRPSRKRRVVRAPASSNTTRTVLDALVANQGAGGYGHGKPNRPLPRFVRAKHERIEPDVDRFLYDDVVPTST